MADRTEQIKLNFNTQPNYLKYLDSVLLSKRYELEQTFLWRNLLLDILRIYSTLDKIYKSLYYKEQPYKLRAVNMPWVVAGGGGGAVFCKTGFVWHVLNVLLCLTYII